MASVYFDPAVGGDGSTVTDDANPTTGLADGGHRPRFVPALSQVVAVAANTVTKANEAAASALAASDSASAASTAGSVAGAVAGASAASALVSQAETAVQISLASANFKGTWSNLSGALSIPSAVLWQSDYWMLVQNVSNVSAHEPGVSSAWEVIQTLPIVRTPEASAPVS